MTSLSIAALFSDPDLGRRTLIDHIQAFTKPPPTRGSSFFIHLSELCPVACKHCMYSSTLSPKTLKDSLNKDDLTTAIAFISESQSAKLNITGGGEPFLTDLHLAAVICSTRTAQKALSQAGIGILGYSLNETLDGPLVLPDFGSLDAGDIFSSVSEKSPVYEPEGFA